MVKQITKFEGLIGKTIIDAVEASNIDYDDIVLRFSDDSFAVFEGGCSYADDSQCSIYGYKIGSEFIKNRDRDNGILVLLGIKTKKELDEFNDKELQERIAINRKQEEAKQVDREKFPTLHKIGVIE